MECWVSVSFCYLWKLIAVLICTRGVQVQSETVHFVTQLPFGNMFKIKVEHFNETYISYVLLSNLIFFYFFSYYIGVKFGKYEAELPWSTFCRKSPMQNLIETYSVASDVKNLETVRNDFPYMHQLCIWSRGHINWLELFLLKEEYEHTDKVLSPER